MNIQQRSTVLPITIYKFHGMPHLESRVVPEHNCLLHIPYSGDGASLLLSDGGLHNVLPISSVQDALVDGMRTLRIYFRPNAVWIDLWFHDATSRQAANYRLDNVLNIIRSRRVLELTGSSDAAVQNRKFQRYGEPQNRAAPLTVTVNVAAAGASASIVKAEPDGAVPPNTDVDAGGGTPPDTNVEAGGGTPPDTNVEAGGGTPPDTNVEADGASPLIVNVNVGAAGTTLPNTNVAADRAESSNAEADGSASASVATEVKEKRRRNTRQGRRGGMPY